jgi:serine/threonine protein kinase
LLALEQLHVHGLIHRDIMSENIIFDGFDGVSHLRLTDTVRVFGTDEVDSQANVGHPGDVYADKGVCILFGSKIASAGLVFLCASDPYGQPVYVWARRLGNGLSVTLPYIEGWVYPFHPHVPR